METAAYFRYFKLFTCKAHGYHNTADDTDIANGVWNYDLPGDIIFLNIVHITWHQSYLQSASWLVIRKTNNYLRPSLKREFRVLAIECSIREPEQHAVRFVAQSRVMQFP